MRRPDEPHMPAHLGLIWEPSWCAIWGAHQWTPRGTVRNTPIVHWVAYNEHKASLCRMPGSEWRPNSLLRFLWNLVLTLYLARRHVQVMWIINILAVGDECAVTSSCKSGSKQTVCVSFSNQVAPAFLPLCITHSESWWNAMVLLPAKCRGGLCLTERCHGSDGKQWRIMIPLSTSEVLWSVCLSVKWWSLSASEVSWSLSVSEVSWSLSVNRSNEMSPLSSGE